MSDYLDNLVARVLSPEAGVFPQLRSTFEPPSLNGGFALSVDFASERLSESNSPEAGTQPISPSLIALAPFEQVPIRDSRHTAQENHLARKEEPHRAESSAKST